jgi:hypothetical protein
MRGARMAEMLDVHADERTEIIRAISKWAGGEEQAAAWCDDEPLPVFGSETTDSLVKAGRIGALRDYLEFLSLGGFA